MQDHTDSSLCQAPHKRRSFALPFFTKSTNNSDDVFALDDEDANMRIPFLNQIPDGIRNHFVVSS